MTVAAYCTQNDVEFVWSDYGVALRIDDRDASQSTARMTQALEKATVDVNSYLFEAYPVESLQNNAWVKWATAYFCAVDLARRRGNGVPEEMAAEYERYKETLAGIKGGNAALVSDTGLAAPRFDTLPMFSNLRVDSRFAQKVRRDTRSSTRTPQAPTRQGNDAVAINNFFW